MYERLLLPTDGSESAERAVEHAIDVAGRYGATLIVVHAVDPAPVPSDVRATTAVLDDLRAAGEAIVDGVVDRAADAGVDATGEVVTGTPHEAILDAVDEHAVDLIVMGTHGRTGLDRMLLGSVAERVLRGSPVPVLTVGPGE